ncbi:glutathione S-transferase family protein [Sneathiella sp.]|uniref:glutathione S-transferase family protein n=1 Tax=Sneathiella sp. TaxID=1964365 RepID=UPI002FE2E455
MKLYDYPGAPSPRWVRIFLAEKGVTLEKEMVDLQKGAHMTEEFRKINPNCTVPVLQIEDGSFISSIDAINRYIEEKYPEPALFGHTAEERAHVNNWCHYIHVNGFLAVAEAMRNSAPFMVGRALTGIHGFEQILALADRGRQRTIYFFEDVNTHLEGRKFMVGDSFSAADIGVLVVVDFAKGMGRIPLPEGLDNLTRWYKEISARPSASA